MLTPTTLWRVPNGSALSWRELDGEWLVHDAGAGAVHVMGTLTAALLDQIHETPRHTADLLVWLRETLPAADAGRVDTALSQALDDLVRADLIEAVSA